MLDYLCSIGRFLKDDGRLSVGKILLDFYAGPVMVDF